MVKASNRKAVLYDRLFDPVCEASFNNLATLAAQLCAVPIALIYFNEVERVWAKAAIDCELAAIVRSLATALSGDEEVAQTSLAVRSDCYRLTAVPIAGMPNGWLCVLDFDSIDLDASQLEALRLLSHQATVQLEQRANEVRLEQVVQQQRQQFHQTVQVLEETKTHLIQTEKLSSLGQMVAEIAHDINNPVSFVHGNILYVSQYIQTLLELLDLYQQSQPTPEIRERLEAIDLEFLSEDLPKTLISMRIGTDRIRQIVLGLRNFARLDGTVKQPADLHESLNNTLIILQHRLKASPERGSIEVIKNYGELPAIDCYAGQLNQVLMNLISNAIEAFDQAEDRPAVPQIQISTEIKQHSALLIRIRDNGTGMKPETRDRIFDPFFTTKPSGKGTGLGLSISRQVIVDRHGGQIHCWSERGQGTEFSIELPLQTSPQLECATAHSTHPTTRPAA